MWKRRVRKCKENRRILANGEIKSGRGQQVAVLRYLPDIWERVSGIQTSRYLYRRVTLSQFNPVLPYRRSEQMKQYFVLSVGLKLKCVSKLDLDIYWGTRCNLDERL